MFKKIFPLLRDIAIVIGGNIIYAEVQSHQDGFLELVWRMLHHVLADCQHSSPHRQDSRKMFYNLILVSFLNFVYCIFPVVDDNTSKTNGEILDELLTKWEEMGYSFKTLEEFQKELDI